MLHLPSAIAIEAPTVGRKSGDGRKGGRSGARGRTGGGGCEAVGENALPAADCVGRRRNTEVCAATATAAYSGAARRGCANSASRADGAPFADDCPINRTILIN